MSCRSLRTPSVPRCTGELGLRLPVKEKLEWWGWYLRLAFQENPSGSDQHLGTLQEQMRKFSISEFLACRASLQYQETRHWRLWYHPRSHSCCSSVCIPVIRVLFRCHLQSNSYNPTACSIQCRGLRDSAARLSASPLITLPCLAVA